VSRREQKFERRAAAEQGAAALRAVLLRQAAETGRSYTAHGIDSAVRSILLQQQQDARWRALKPKQPLMAELRRRHEAEREATGLPVASVTPPRE
jgi:chloramphenicol 3-O-phosphotransferase